MRACTEPSRPQRDRRWWSRAPSPARTTSNPPPAASPSHFAKNPSFPPLESGASGSGAAFEADGEPSRFGVGSAVDGRAHRKTNALGLAVFPHHRDGQHPVVLGMGLTKPEIQAPLGFLYGGRIELGHPEPHQLVSNYRTSRSIFSEGRDLFLDFIELVLRSFLFPSCNGDLKGELLARGKCLQPK